MTNQPLKILALIGARSGSKGVACKNIRPLAGKPLMAWVIEAALKSHHVNRVIVSTDSPEYAEIAKKFGAEVPHLRPAELAADLSPEFDYVAYVLKWLEEHEDYRPDVVVRLLPTVPMQLPEDIDACIDELLKDPSADSAVVIAEARQHPLKALKLADDGQGGKRIVTYFSENGREVTPIARQNYEKAYFRANVIASRPQTIKEKGSLTGDTVRYHLIPQERSIDIDSLADFFLIEQMMRANQEKRSAPANLSAKAMHIKSDQVDQALEQEAQPGKRLLEPLKTLAAQTGFPCKILEICQTVNEAEVHMDKGDLWYCLEGEPTFVCGGQLVDPQARVGSDGVADNRELKAKEICGGETVTLSKGDWFWIPPGVPHMHRTEGVARMMIIKIPSTNL